MSKQRSIKGEGQGVSLTVWVSEAIWQAIEDEAQKGHTRRSTIVRRILEDKFSKRIKS